MTDDLADDLERARAAWNKQTLAIVEAKRSGASAAEIEAMALRLAKLKQVYVALQDRAL